MGERSNVRHILEETPRQKCVDVYIRDSRGLVSVQQLGAVRVEQNKKIE